MKKFQLLIATFTSLASLMLLSGCMGDILKPRADPTKYYMLSSANDLPVQDGAKNIMLNLSQVRMPAYMMRQQIVSAKDSSSEIVISDIHRLPEFPVDAFTRVIATNISKIARSENVYAYPAMAPDENCISLRVTIVECMGVIGKTLDFKARWELIKTEGSKVTAQRTKLFIKQLPAGENYDGYISAINKGLGELSEDIVKGIVEFKKECAKTDSSAAKKLD